MIYCDICKTALATLHITKLENGHILELHFCQKCASEKSVSHIADSDHVQDNLDELLKQESAGSLDADGIPGMLHNKAHGKAAKPAVVCPGCGLSFARFRETGKLGCSECYKAFRDGKDGLFSLIKRIHGSIHHLGKYPSKQIDSVHRTQQLGELRQKLHEAVREENYEMAANLRDQIHQIENQ